MRSHSWVLVRRFPVRVAVAAAVAAAFLFGLSVGGVGAAGTGPAVQVHSVQTTEKVIALTFDDGPNPVYTPEILALLQRYGAHATFFVIGQELLQYPAVARSEVAAGMELGNHGFHHLAMRGLDPTAVQSEALPVEQEITTLTGNRPTVFRLPRGHGDRRVVRALGDMGYVTVNWSIDSRDWALPGASRIASTVLKHAAPGAIVLFHDGGGNRSQTVQALATILPVLKAEGYRFVTVSQLLQMGAARA